MHTKHILLFSANVIFTCSRLPVLFCYCYPPEIETLSCCFAQQLHTSLSSCHTVLQVSYGSEIMTLWVVVCQNKRSLNRTPQSAHHAGGVEVDTFSNKGVCVCVKSLCLQLWDSGS